MRRESLPARGVWIEIWLERAMSLRRAGRSPQGECGLKCDIRPTGLRPVESLPARGVWIEIGGTCSTRWPCMSLPARGVWIEIHAGRRWNPATARSLPARGVWIEIGFGEMLRERRMSLPARGVWIEIAQVRKHRNRWSKSLPARGVWIEITSRSRTASRTCTRVAPRKGSVD